ncbi:MAG: hypothetical protein CML04_04015 [Pseudozobellia sp.]|nr:hypothetical protein [Pseudozobellia sp.]MBG49311.1 hypothetical protein [Pseudozobellia sp.]|tara:strand:+ start:1233 stop:3980 length:2748 start_codon:yes stop_codon:yes gene_type:complete
MRSFIDEVVHDIAQKHYGFDSLIVVLPSKRAGTFLRTALAKNTGKTFFSPEIFSIESFVEKISGLLFANNTQQLFTLYECYLEQPYERKDDFFAFSKWAQTLLQDFNEIDRYLVDANELFSNLAAIQEINHWSLQEEKTDLMVDYLKFWDSLDNLYSDFCTKLLHKGMGHQGLVYRKACEAIEGFVSTHANKHFVFVGFNALNTSESRIIQYILNSTRADIYWDVDEYFLDDDIHDAGLFIRQHFNSWPFFEQNSPKGISSNFLSKKHIEVIGIPKNISQAKYLGQLLRDLSKSQVQNLQNTAVVLGDETLMNTIINSIPDEVEGINITMGYPLSKTPMASVFDDLLDLYITRTEQGWFHLAIESFLAHPYIRILFDDDGSDKVATALESIKKNNWAYLNSERLSALLESEMAPLLFTNKPYEPAKFIELCKKVVLALKEVLIKRRDHLGLEYLYRFFTLFNQLSGLVEENTFVKDLRSLQALYRELVNTESLDFQGEPLEGLQIMGMLESRNLDFETVILTSVNEGILPSGKSNNSFIPFDLKVRLGLPTYKEKDAVYTYHFYRLLQRAKNIYILYNTEPDVLEGGEPSRLIRQLLADDHFKDSIVEKIAAPTIVPQMKTPEMIEKDSHLISLIKEHSNRGFSPTSLSNYVRNPIDFYKRNLLGIDDVLEVEENIAANTFGTIVHDVLEELYTPFIGHFLEKDKMDEAKKKVTTLVNREFSKTFFGGDISRGKNFIAYNVIVRYIENFIDMEIKEIESHRIKILALEENLKVDFPIPELDFPVRLKGKLDRIDEYDGVLRIIDYKTGKVTQPQVEIVNWEELISDYKYSKAFQLLCYAIMYTGLQPINQIQAGIFSFKNLNSGILSFATKESSRSRTKDYIINNEVLDTFTFYLRKLIVEICSPQQPFVEKEIE